MDNYHNNTTQLMEQLRQQYEQLKEEVDDIAEKVSTILALLQGNELNQMEGGLVSKVFADSKRLDKLEKFRDRSMWIIVGIGIGGGIGITKLLGWLIEISAK